MTENYNVKALDDGYGDAKYDSKGTPSLIPSFVTTFKAKPKDNFSSGSTHANYIASSIDGIKYVVGESAMKLDTNVKWIGGEQKHSDTRFPVLLKTVLGLMTSGNREVVDTLMMNLPIKYDTPERRTLLESIARGTHEVSISRDGVNFVEKVIIVESVDIKKQPFGSLCDVILDDNGEIINKEIAKAFNVIVDIGARTLNILTVDALEEQPELSYQTNDGMFTAYTQVGRYLEDELGVIIPDGKLPIIMGTREIKGMDISMLIDRVYANLANTIMTTLDKVLINSWAFVGNIIFTGGGADKALLQPYLAEAFKNRANTLFLDRYSNVRGLRRYGIRQAKKNIKRNNVTVRVDNHVNRY